MTSGAQMVTGRSRRSPDGAADDPAAGPITVVARQGIHDGRGRVVAHELLFRTIGATKADITDADAATAEVLISAFTDIGLDELVGDHLAFVNVPHRFLVDGMCHILPCERVVLEILEDVPVDDEVVAAVADLVDAGYTVALDDFEFRPELAPLVELADIIKVDLLALADDELDTTLARLAACHRARGSEPLRLLAEKVEDRDRLPGLAAAGFELFQGYALERPETVHAGQRTVMLQVLSELHRPDREIGEVVEVISHDPSLAYALLRIVNSAATSRGTRISSLRHAVVMLGLDAVRNWATLLLMTRVSGGSPEAIAPALVRAKLSERIAEAWGMSGAVGFTLGMLASLPDVVGQTLPAIVAGLSLETEVEQALLDHRGPYGRILACAIAYEDGDRRALAELEAPASLADAALAGLVWARQVTTALAPTTGDRDSGHP